MAKSKQPNKLARSALTSLTLDEAAQLVRQRKVSPVELAEACLERITRLDHRINAFITISSGPAMEQARAAEKALRSRRRLGPLHGIPIALKDNIDTAGVPTTAASALFEQRVPEQDAEIVKRLAAAGAVIVGKLNLHEFAYGASSVVSHFSPVRNPWNLNSITGGSSSGSAAALAAGFCYAAVGTDTAGSIRLPAAYCGVVGLKPTYGRVSARGVVPLSWTLDHVGPMARTVRDVAILLQVLAGHDAGDPASVKMPVPDFERALGKKGKLRIGVARKFFFEALHPEIERTVDVAIGVMRKFASSVRDIEIPVFEDLTTARAEAYAYHRVFAAKNPELYQAATLKRVLTGKEVGAAEYIERRREIEQLRRIASSIFQDVDIVVTPTVPVPPFKIADLLADMESLRGKETFILRNTRPFNALGVPTLSLPCGFTSDGMPIGLQVSAAPFEEATLLRMAHAYEQETGWHKHEPNLPSYS